RWLEQTYRPTTQRLREALGPRDDETELYCQVLEHKWYLSERAKKDVGHQVTLEDYIKNRLAPPPETPELVKPRDDTRQAAFGVVSGGGNPRSRAPERTR